ncbi:MAG TPA: hypothetical protein VH879_14640 [Gemmatimonadales bacterium]
MVTTARRTARRRFEAGLGASSRIKARAGSAATGWPLASDSA